MVESLTQDFEPHRHHCMVLSKNINPSLVPVQPRKTRSFITERLLMGRKNQIKQTKQNAQLSMKLIILINVKMPTIVDILIYLLGG